MTAVAYVDNSKDTATLTAGTSMSFSLSNSDIDAEAFPDAIVVVAINVHTSTTSGVTAPESATIGGIEAAIQWQISDVGFGTGKTHLVLATVRVPEAGFDSVGVIVSWSTCPTSGTVVKASANAFYNVDPSSDDFALGFVATTGLTAGPLTVPADGAVFAANIEYTGNDFSPNILSQDTTAYTMQSPAVTLANGHVYETGYRLFAADATETVVPEVEDEGGFRPVIAFVMAGVSPEDDFNCACEDESDNETLAALRRRMLVRLGFAAQADSPPPGMADLLDDFLRSSQRYLYRKFPGIRMERFFKWTMVAGQRFYDLPDNDDTCDKKLDPYKVDWVGVQDLNDAWYQLVEGIPPEFYTSVAFQGIPSRYEIRQCIEVFCAPSAAYTLRVKGKFGLSAFVDDDDKTSVDSELVFLWALGTAKAHYRHPDAHSVKVEARDYLGTLVSGAHLTARYVPGSVPLPPWARPLFLPLVQ